MNGKIFLQAPASNLLAAVNINHKHVICSQNSDIQQNRGQKSTEKLYCLRPCRLLAACQKLFETVLL